MVTVTAETSWSSTVDDAWTALGRRDAYLCFPGIAPRGRRGGRTLDHALDLPIVDRQEQTATLTIGRAGKDGHRERRFALSGELVSITGLWRLEPIDTGVRVLLSLDYDIAAPAQDARGEHAAKPEPAADPDRRRRDPEPRGRRVLRDALRGAGRRVLRAPARASSTRAPRDEARVTIYVLQRLVGLVPVLFGISVVIFLTMKLIPGDVARALLGPMATDQSLAQLRHALGLDEAIYVQYGKWLWRALHGDLGLSPIVHKPVVDILLPKFGNTLILAGASFLLAVVGGVAVGVLAASRRQGLVDRAVMGASLVVGNMPPFWLGLVLIVFFAINLRWLPSLGMYSARGPGGLEDLLAHLVLPTIATAAAPGAIIARMTRASVLEILGPGLHQGGAIEGLCRARRARGARAARRVAGDPDDLRSPARLPPGRRGLHRGSVRMAGPRAASSSRRSSRATCRSCRARRCSSRCRSCWSTWSWIC